MKINLSCLLTHTSSGMTGSLHKKLSMQRFGHFQEWLAEEKEIKSQKYGVGSDKLLQLY